MSPILLAAYLQCVMVGGFVWLAATCRSMSCRIGWVALALAMIGVGVRRIQVAYPGMWEPVAWPVQMFDTAMFAIAIAAHGVNEWREAKERREHRQHRKNGGQAA